MKKLFFTVSAIAALSFLVSSAGFAQHEVPNQIGLYLTDDGFGATGTQDVDVPVEVFLVLTKPTDVKNDDAPYSTIQAFECALNFNPSGSLFKLRDILPPNAINIGDNSDISQGFLEYIVAFGVDWPLTNNESVWLVAFTFMTTGTDPIEVTLGPSSVPTIEGEMAFMSERGQLRVMHPVSGSQDQPVFIFNGEAVVKNQSFRRVKSLFR